MSHRRKPSSAHWALRSPLNESKSRDGSGQLILGWAFSIFGQICQPEKNLKLVSDSESNFWVSRQCYWNFGLTFRLGLYIYTAHIPSFDPGHGTIHLYLKGFSTYNIWMRHFELRINEGEVIMLYFVLWKFETSDLMEPMKPFCKIFN